MDILFLLWKFPWKLLVRLLRWAGKGIATRLVLPVLKQRHQHHLDVRAWQRRWETLVGPIEYQLLLASTLTNSPAPVSRLLLRNAGAEDVADLRVRVVARRGTLSLPEAIHVDFIKSGEITSNVLVNIPVQHIMALESTIKVAYDSIEICARIAEDGGQSTPLRLVRSESIGYMEFMNVGWWVRFQDRLYNTKAIEECAIRIQHVLCRRIADRSGLMSLSPGGYFEQVFRTKRYWQLPIASYYSLLSTRKVRLSYCWLMLIAKRREIRFLERGPEWLRTTHATGSVNKSGKGFQCF